jgi:hypothetical protein
MSCRFVLKRAATARLSDPTKYKCNLVRCSVGPDAARVVLLLRPLIAGRQFATPRHTSFYGRAEANSLIWYALPMRISYGKIFHEHGRLIIKMRPATPINSPNIESKSE